MDGRMRAAVQCLEALRGVPTLVACHAAVILAGVSLIDAAECSDGACCCAHGTHGREPGKTPAIAG
jgi:hypothetical protein